MYYGSKFNKYVSNIKQTWATIIELLNKCKNKKEFPSYFIINGDKIDNKKDIGNNFNSFFQNIGPALSANIPQHQNITTLGSRFGFCVVSEPLQASRCVVDRPLAVLTGLAEPDPVTRSGKKQTWGSIFKSHTL